MKEHNHPPKERTEDKKKRTDESLSDDFRPKTEERKERAKEIRNRPENQEGRQKDG